MISFLLTPIQARQHIYIFYGVFAAIGLAIVLIIVRKIIIAINKNKPQGAERLAQKHTTIRTIAHLVKIYSLNQDERDWLVSIIKHKKIPNLEYNFRSEQFCETFFNEQYNLITEEDTAINDAEVQKKLATMYSLRQKIENARKSLYTFTSTTALPVGQKLYYFSNKKDQYETEILQNTKDGLLITIPKDVLQNDIKPPVLSEITLFHITKVGYAFLINVPASNAMG